MLTILLIDANTDDRQYYVDRLRMCSADNIILEAKDWRTAVELYQSQKIDCVVLELALPDRSGLAALVDLVERPRYPQFPVVVLTRLTIAPVLDLALSHGAYACLLKDETSGDELDKVIHRAMAAIGPARKERGE